MATYIQGTRPISVATPLPPDTLLLTGFSGREAISQLFSFHLDLIAENKVAIPFEELLGQKIIIRLASDDDDEKRYFSGICARMSQGSPDEIFTHYQMEVVPQFWLLTKVAQSRIFQHKNVPDILKEVLKGLDVEYQLQGTFEPRDFCVQYRETDFNFASRLMEEEGIFYFFKHTEEGHKLVVANSPQSHSPLPGPPLIFDDIEGGQREEERVYSWQKMQELRSGKYTLWDHCFELPHKHLEAEQLIQDSVSVGEVTHKLKVGNNDKLELYDYPGGYAQRFDGVDKGGGDRPSDVQKIFQDNKRTVAIRMQQEELPSLVIHAASNCRQLVTGNKFELTKHAHAEGTYVLTSVAHSARWSTGDYRSDGGEFDYTNSFTCIPQGLPFRPAQATAKPVVQGTQTAVVVGPAGEEIFVDKYGRVKVQFHWDRQGKNDADSSCWVRVSTLWAGTQWGMIHIPRIGQEVVVDFLEGDPDQPIIVGSVYNAAMMPPYALPANKTQSGIKSRSSLGGGPANFNEIRFEDKKGQEQVYIHAEKNEDIVVENDKTESVGHDETITIGHDRTETVKHDETLTVENNRTRTVIKNETVTVAEMRSHTVGKNESVTVGQNQEVSVGQNQDIAVGANQSTSVGNNCSLTVLNDTTISSGKNISGSAGMEITLTAGVAITLVGPGGMIKIDASGVTIQGVLVKIN